MENEPKYITLDNLQVLVENMYKAPNIASLMKKHEYGSYLDFPLVGNSNDVYVDTSANAIYRWNNEELHYYCIGRDYQDIDIIDGGAAE